MRALVGITDGQPWRSSGIFGGYGLLSVADAAKEYAAELKVRQKVGDAGYWKDTWWPFANNGSGQNDRRLSYRCAGGHQLATQTVLLPTGVHPSHTP